MSFYMRPISLSVSEDEYEALRRVAKAQRRPVAQLIREAITWYRTEKLEARTKLERVPVLAGHRHREPSPARAELYDDIFAPRAGSEP